MSLRDVLLSPRQREVLAWIGDGCPVGVMNGHAHKIQANALKNRRLVTISKRRGVWAAELTNGRYYLEHNAYPPPSEAPVTDPQPPRASTTRPDPAPAARPVSTTPTMARAPRPARPSGVARQLIADLEAAGGELRVDSATDASGYDARVRAAIRFGMVPEGKLLTIDGWPGSRERTIRLEDKPEWMTATLAPVSVPGQLRNPHKVVLALQGKDSVLYVDSKVRTRSLRIVQALSVEATRRGHVAKPIVVRRDTYGFPQLDTKDTFTITVAKHEVGVRVQQINDRIPHEPTRQELAQAEKYSWQRIPSHDSVPSDRLKITLSGRFEHRQSTWADSKTRSLDDVLAEILQEIELRAAAAEREHTEQLAAAERRRHEWEQAMARAKIDYRKAKRAAVLDRQATDWEKSRQLLAYIIAMEATLESTVDAVAAREWIEWARQHAEDLNPLRRRLELPQPREPQPADLEPFLHGHSPYGPREQNPW